MIYTLLICLSLVFAQEQAHLKKEVPRGKDFLYTDWDKAEAEAFRTGKPMFVYVTASYCGACRKMEQTTFRDTSVVGFLKNNYVNVMLTLDDKKQKRKATSYNLKAVPTVIYTSYKGKKIMIDEGYQSSEDVLTDGQTVLNKICKKRRYQKR